MVWFQLLESSLASFLDPSGEKHSHSMMLPCCYTAGMMFYRMIKHCLV